jgi:hypothetical protein
VRGITESVGISTLVYKVQGLKRALSLSVSIGDISRRSVAFTRLITALESVTTFINWIKSGGLLVFISDIESISTYVEKTSFFRRVISTLESYSSSTSRIVNSIRRLYNQVSSNSSTYRVYTGKRIIENTESISTMLVKIANFIVKIVSNIGITDFIHTIVKTIRTIILYGNRQFAYALGKIDLQILRGLFDAKYFTVLVGNVSEYVKVIRTQIQHLITLLGKR